MTSPTLRPLEADATVEQLPRRSTLDSVIFCGVFGLLLFNPLAFGAVEPWSIFILEWSASLLFVLWALRQAKSGELLVVWNPLWVLKKGCSEVLLCCVSSAARDSFLRADD
jgi:hypothetical protein